MLAGRSCYTRAMIYLTTALAIAFTISLAFNLRQREWVRILTLHLNARAPRKHVTTALPLVRRRSWTRMFTQGEELPSFAMPRDIR